MTVGLRLKDLRLEKGVSQKEAASKTGYSNAIISEWERGVKQPTAQAIIKLADYFQVSTDYLLGISEIDKYEAPHLNTAVLKPELLELIEASKELNPSEICEVKGFIAGIKKRNL